MKDIRSRRIPDRGFYSPDDDDDLYDHGMGLDDDDDFYHERHVRGRQRYFIRIAMTCHSACSNHMEISSVDLRLRSVT
eukprot:1219315-Amphidinium_carterae.2